MARIESIEQLCDAQTKLSSDLDYWTALKRNNLGLLQWGLLPTNSVDVSPELVDRTGPADRCYAISKSAMKLKSMNCSSALPVLTSYPKGEVYRSLSILHLSYEDFFQCLLIISVNNSSQLIPKLQKEP